jgi:hypothetical protein
LLREKSRPFVLERAPRSAPERILHNGITIQNGRIFVYMRDFLLASLQHCRDKFVKTKDGKIVPTTLLLENLGWCTSFINGTLIIDVRWLFNIDYVLRDDRALNLLAFLFIISGILKHNEEEKVAAVKILRHAADRGNLCAKLNLGCCLERGVDVKQDDQEAVRLYRQIAEEADRLYGRIAEEADRHGRIEDWASVPFCGVYALAQYRYGRCLFCGTGVPKDVKEAVKYFKLSAYQGNPIAQYYYGNCLEYGVGIAKKEQDAVKYYKLSADQGYDVAQRNYGVCLEKGIGVERNIAEAVKYYRLCANQGRPCVQRRLEGLERELSQQGKQ